MILYNDYDSEFEMDDLQKAKVYFEGEEVPSEDDYLGDNYETFKSDWMEYREGIRTSNNLEELCDVLNRYENRFGNGSTYFVKE